MFFISHYIQSGYHLDFVKLIYLLIELQHINNIDFFQIDNTCL